MAAGRSSNEYLPAGRLNKPQRQAIAGPQYTCNTRASSSSAYLLNAFRPKSSGNLLTFLRKYSLPRFSGQLGVHLSRLRGAQAPIILVVLGTQTAAENGKHSMQKSNFVSCAYKCAILRCLCKPTSVPRGDLIKLNAVPRMQSVSLNKGSKMLNFINARMRVTIADSRVLVGTFMAFDKHMNVVLGDCEEFRRVKVKKAGGAGGTCSLRCSALALSELLRLRLGLIACGDACS